MQSLYINRYEIEDSIKSFERVCHGSEASIEVRIYGKTSQATKPMVEVYQKSENKANLVVFLSRKWNPIGMLPYPDQLLVLCGRFINKKQTFGITSTSATEIKIFIVITKKLTQE